MRRVEEHDGAAVDTEPGGLTAVAVQEALEVRCDAECPPPPELAGFVVRRQDQPRFGRVPEELGQSERLLRLVPPPGDGEPVHPRRAGLRQLRTNTGRVAAVVGPAFGVVGRADVEPPGRRHPPGVVEAQDSPVVRRLDPVIPVPPAAARTRGRPVPGIVDREDQLREQGSGHRVREGRRESRRRRASPGDRARDARHPPPGRQAGGPASRDADEGRRHRARPTPTRGHKRATGQLEQ